MAITVKDNLLTTPSPSGTSFTTGQKEYLDGFLRAAFSNPLPMAQTAKNECESGRLESPGSEKHALGHKAQLAWLAAGKRLSKEEQIKFESDPLECWETIAGLAEKDALPTGADVFRLKFHGLWNVSPAQEAMMCRLRVPGGILKAYQMDAIAAAAEAFGGGYTDITTRANLQIREIPARHMAHLLTDLHEAGIVPRGSGADNIRNITGNPAAGIDPDEFYNVLPLCRELHHYILHNRDMYGLPRKFNVAFDGGGSISCLEDTNDIGFKAVKVDGTLGGNGVEGDVEPGIYFRVALGGITGHKDFARDTGLLLKPGECLPMAVAIIKAFIALGDRGNRKKARLKYVLDSLGLEGFLEEVGKLFPFALRRYPADKCLFPKPVNKAAHLGIHPQSRKGFFYMGVDVPVGRLTVAQMRGLASLMRQCGSDGLRLTVWQNLLLSDIPEGKIAEVGEGLASLGLSHRPNAINAGLVACTGSEGCKFGMAPTKSTALAISAYLNQEVDLDQPINIHLTGCPHSCAQHFIGDIGLLGASTEEDGIRVPAFHVLVGGGYGQEARIGVQTHVAIPTRQIRMVLESMLKIFLERRRPAETFTDFTRRHSNAELLALFQPRHEQVLANTNRMGE